MLQPKRMKHRRHFRGTWRKVATKGVEVSFGDYGIRTTEPGWITDRQIEACRVILSRATRKIGKFWIRIFPDKPYTKKPPEVTMGGGKGEVSHYVASVTPGRMLFELTGLDEPNARKVFKNISSKLPVRARFVSKDL
ncbi:MAG: 50S ribosomal protein L16 [Microgenomates bacterium OLB22]|nr:MAG: 50S ribosomal protein L16 [Microgenomates bacterium OLB22]